MCCVVHTKAMKKNYEKINNFFETIVTTILSYIVAGKLKVLLQFCW